jgi:hypothetical protein
MTDGKRDRFSGNAREFYMGISSVGSISSSILSLPIEGAGSVRPTATVAAPSQPSAAPQSADVSGDNLSQLADLQIQIVLQNRQADLQRATLTTLLNGLSQNAYQGGQASPQQAGIDVRA